MNTTRSFLISVLLTLGVSLCFGACGHKAEQQTPPAWPQELHWPAVNGADSYLVRVWSGYRLLFQESSSDTLLALNENMLRVLSDCDSLSLEVKALDASETPLAGGHKRYELSQFQTGP